MKTKVHVSKYTYNINRGWPAPANKVLFLRQLSIFLLVKKYNSDAESVIPKHFILSQWARYF